MSVRLMSLVFEFDMPILNIKDKKNNEINVPDSTAKFVLLALADHASDEGEGAYPSITRLCHKTSMSRTTVCNAIKALRENGFILYEGESKVHTNNYTIIENRLVQPLDLSKSSHWTLDSPATRLESSFNHPINHEKKSRKIELPPGSDLGFQLLAGVPLEEIERQTKEIESAKERTDEFERQMGYNPLPWGDKKLDKLAKFLAKQSLEDIRRFALWSKREFSSFNPAKARQFPDQVIDLWPQACPPISAPTKPQQREPEPEYVTDLAAAVRKLEEVTK